MKLVSAYSNRESKEQLCEMLNLPQSVYYYKPKEGKRGAKPSTHTIKRDGSVVPNSFVIEDIRTSLSREFCCYGYQNITSDLRDFGYIINPKKVLFDIIGDKLGSIVISDSHAFDSMGVVYTPE